MNVRLLLALGALAVSNLGQAQTGPSLKTPLGLTQITGVTASWPGECAAGVLNNTSSSRQNSYHSITVTSSSGTWTAALNYSNSSCSGPWTSFGSAATITQSSSPPIAVGFGYHPYIQIVITGTAMVNYSAQNQLGLVSGSGGGSVSYPITVPLGGTGLTSFMVNCLPYGAGSSTLGCLSPGTQYQVYQAGSGGVPALGALNLSQSAAVTGTLPGTNYAAVNLAGASNGGVTGILPVVSGGSGTATPGLVGGTGIGISGSWPDQTVTYSGITDLTSTGGGGVSGILPVANGGSGTDTPSLVGGTNIGISGSWPNQTIDFTGGSGSGTVTQVGLSMPSWLSVSGSPVTGSGTLGVVPTTGQTPHQVIGTCNTATSFGPCPLGVTDLPSGYPYSSLASTPTLYYQTLQVGGSAATQRPTVNFIQGTNVVISCVDNGGSLRTDCTISSSGGGGGGGMVWPGTPGIMLYAGSNTYGTSLVGAHAGDVLYWTGSAWAVLTGNASGTQWLQETSAGVPSWTVPAGAGNVSTSGSPAQYQVGVWASGTTIAGIAPSATVGVPFLSAGASANPAFGALNLAGGSSIVTGILPAANLPAALANSTSINGTSVPSSSNLVINSGSPTTGAIPKFTNSAIIGNSNLAENADGSDSAAKALTWASCGTAAAFDLSQSNCYIFTASGSNPTITVSNPHGSGPYSFGFCNDTSARTWTLPASFKQINLPTSPSTCTYNPGVIYNGTNYEAPSSAAWPPGNGIPIVSSTGPSWGTTLARSDIPVSILDYGGSTAASAATNTTALNNALAASKRVYLPGNTTGNTCYSLTPNGVTIPANSIVYGDGQINSCVAIFSTGSAFIIGGNNVILEHFGITGTTASGTVGITDTGGYNALTLNDILIKNGGSHGLVLTSTTWVTLNNCYILNNGGNGISAGNGVTNLILSNNTIIYENAGSGVSSTGTGMLGFQCVGGTSIQDNGATDVTLGTGTSSTVFDNCYFETGYGTRAQQAHAIDVTGALATSIAGGFFHDYTAGDIYSSAATSGLTVSANATFNHYGLGGTPNTVLLTGTTSTNVSIGPINDIQAVGYNLGTAVNRYVNTDGSGVSTHLAIWGGSPGLLIDGGAVGTAAAANTGTSGPTVPLLNAVNAWGKTQSVAVNTVPSSATPAFDLSLGNVQYIAALATSASPTFTNITAGGWWKFIICNDSSGGYTWAWPASVHGGIVIGTNPLTCTIQNLTSPDGSRIFGEPGVINQ